MKQVCFPLKLDGINVGTIQFWLNTTMHCYKTVQDQKLKVVEDDMRITRWKLIKLNEI